jgi:hypothetical protein
MSELGEQFTNSIRAYCNDEGTEVYDWSSDREHYVIITGDITLDQIGSMHDHFHSCGEVLKIEYIWVQRHCFKITKEDGM